MSQMPAWKASSQGPAHEGHRREDRCSSAASASFKRILCWAWAWAPSEEVSGCWAEAKLRLRGRGSKFLEGPEQKALPSASEKSKCEWPTCRMSHLIACDVFLAGVFGPLDALRQRARPRLLRGS